MATAALQQLQEAGQTRWKRARILVRKLWRGIRDWCGDSAYERYLIASKKRTSRDPAGPVAGGPAEPSCPPLSQEQFYVEQLKRRYSRPNRCC